VRKLKEIEDVVKPLSEMGEDMANPTIDEMTDSEQEAYYTGVEQGRIELAKDLMEIIEE
jgi:hypothetical protein